MDRKTELLIAAYKLLNKQNETPYVLNMLSTTVYYDGAECDGSCLMEDIESCLFEEGIDINNENDVKAFIEEREAEEMSK